jgi:hypothetical protein
MQLYREKRIGQANIGAQIARLRVTHLIIVRRRVVELLVRRRKVHVVVVIIVRAKRRPNLLNRMAGEGNLLMLS